MEYINRNPKIILIAGKALSGKSTVCKYLEDLYKKEKMKVFVSPYTKYLKQYISNITGEEINESNKPRFLLQNLSSELIKKELGNYDFFINRQIEDIDFYSYFMDVIIIPDVRFPKEIDVIKKKYDNVFSILVYRDNFDNGLSDVEKNDVTETSLDNYNEFDYVISNNDDKLDDKVLEIFKDINGGK